MKTKATEFQKSNRDKMSECQNSEGSTQRSHNFRSHPFDDHTMTSNKAFPRKTSMRRCVTGITSMAALVLLASSTQVDAFTTPTPMSRRVAAPPVTPYSRTVMQQRWAKPLDMDTEFVNDDDTESRMENIKQMHLDDEKPVVQKKYTNPTPVLFKAFEEMVMKNAAMAAVAALALTLFMTPLPSMAAMSGGRMGGSFSAPRQSSGSISPSRSYGGSYYGGSGYARGYSRGLTSGYYSRGPTVLVNPFPTPMVSPFYSPGYYGGPGVITYSSGGFGLLPLLLFGGLAFAAVSAMSNTMASTASSWTDSASPSLWGSSTQSALGSGTSVVQVSVALEVPNRDDRNSILSVLGRLANSARTDTRVGIQNLTSQVALELLRRKNSIVSASTNYKHYGDREKALRDFNQRSIKERSKFESETVSNYGGIDFGRGSGSSLDATDGKATMAVVTLLLTIDGDSTKVPQIRSPSDVEEALRMIASDSKVDSSLQGAEILWTPEDRAETLSTRDVIADYPELRSI